MAEEKLVCGKCKEDDPCNEFTAQDGQPVPSTPKTLCDCGHARRQHGAPKQVGEQLLTKNVVQTLLQLPQLIVSMNDSLKSQGAILRGHLLGSFEPAWRDTLSEWSNRPANQGVFEKKLHNYYIGIRLNHDGTKADDQRRECLVTGARQLVEAAHIFPAAANPNLLSLVGLEADDVNHERNGLFLVKGLEKAFDRRQAAFFLHDDGTIRLHVLDDRLANVSYFDYTGKTDATKWPRNCPPNQTFGTIEGRQLNFGPQTPPYRRLLAVHAELGRIRARVHGWRAIDEATVDTVFNKNHATFRRMSPIPAGKLSILVDDEDPVIKGLLAGSDESKNPV